MKTRVHKLTNIVLLGSILACAIQADARICYDNYAAAQDEKLQAQEIAARRIEKNDLQKRYDSTHASFEASGSRLATLEMARRKALSFQSHSQNIVEGLPDLQALLDKDEYGRRAIQSFLVMTELKDLRDELEELPVKIELRERLKAILNAFFAYAQDEELVIQGSRLAFRSALAMGGESFKGALEVSRQLLAEKIQDSIRQVNALHKPKEEEDEVFSRLGRAVSDMATTLGGLDWEIEVHTDEMRKDAAAKGEHACSEDIPWRANLK